MLRHKFEIACEGETLRRLREPSWSLHSIQGFGAHVTDHGSHRTVLFPGLAGASEGDEDDPSWWARGVRGAARTFASTWDEALEELVRHVFRRSTDTVRAAALTELRHALGMTK